jgi:hypothetical protein
MILSLRVGRFSGFLFIVRRKGILLFIGTGPEWYIIFFRFSPSLRPEVVPLEDVKQTFLEGFSATLSVMFSKKDRI